MKQIYTISKSSKSRMQRFEKPHAVREPQFGHTWCRFSLDENISVLFCCSITIACDIIIWLM